jgi:hypothetical protein
MDLAGADGSKTEDQSTKVNGTAEFDGSNSEK